MSHIIAKPGDIIGFSGRSLRSDFINLATGGVPRRGISHVGIIGLHGGNSYLFEATNEVHWCQVRNAWAVGFQAHQLSSVIENFNGRVWHYRLYRRLYSHENDALSTMLSVQMLLGRSYDYGGAVRCGGLIWSWLNSKLRRESLEELFCSEAVAAAEARIGIFPTTNASRWSPNKLVRTMRRAGLLCKPKRIK